MYAQTIKVRREGGKNLRSLVPARQAKSLDRGPEGKCPEENYHASFRTRACGVELAMRNT